jgi:hypothetical protein
MPDALLAKFSLQSPLVLKLNKYSLHILHKIPQNNFHFKVLYVFHGKEETPERVMYTDPPYFCDEEVAE